MRHSACVHACADTAAASRPVLAAETINAERADAPDTGAATTSQPADIRP